MNFEPNDNFVYFLYWTCERMNIFWKRFNNEKQPYTEDEILRDNKFTNVYRVLDRSSQYLIRNIIQNGKQYSNESMLWRILLYKHFNIPATWEYLIKEFGDVSLDVPTKDIAKVLTEFRLKSKQPIYSNAYMMTASFMKNEAIKKKYGISNSSSKHEAYLQIFQKAVIETEYFNDILKAKSFEEAFLRTREIITVGDFIAYQYVQDYNYTSFMNFDDNSFNAAGPGTIRGIDKCFNIIGKTDYQAVVKWVQKNFIELLEIYGDYFETEFKFKGLPNWNPTVPDISNCFCETDKYTRMLGIHSGKEKKNGTRMKSSFKENSQKIKYEFPEKWGVVFK